MIGLNFLYILALQSMIALRVQDTRFVPFVLMTWMVQPIVNSVIAVSVLGGKLRQPIDPEYPNFYTRVDTWFYVSIAIAAFLCWVAFDRRRDMIQAQFPNLLTDRLFKYRFLILSSQLAFSILLSYVSHVSPWYCLIVFAAAVGLGSIAASSYRNKANKGDGGN